MSLLGVFVWFGGGFFLLFFSFHYWIFVFASERVNVQVGQLTFSLWDTWFRDRCEYMTLDHESPLCSDGPLTLFHSLSTFVWTKAKTNKVVAHFSTRTVWNRSSPEKLELSSFNLPAQQVLRQNPAGTLFPVTLQKYANSWYPRTKQVLIHSTYPLAFVSVCHKLQ